MPNQKPPKEVHVKVRVTDVAAETFVFESKDIEIGPKNEITFKNDEEHYGFEIHYELEGADGYRFPEDLDEALYVEAGSKGYCPQSRSQWGKFKPLEVRSGNGGERRVLLVDNKNDSKKEFAYTLRAKNGSKWLTLDPGGTNENGGSPFVDNAINSTVLIGIAAVGLLTVAYFAFR